MGNTFVLIHRHRRCLGVSKELLLWTRGFVLFQSISMDIALSTNYAFSSVSAGRPPISGFIDMKEGGKGVLPTDHTGPMIDTRGAGCPHAP